MTVGRIALTAKLLRTLQPIASLSALRRDEIAALCRVEHIPAGLTLFREGEIDHRSIYLLQGEVVLSSAAGGVSRVLTGPGIAGTPAPWLYPIADKQPRQLSAVSVTDVDIVQMDSELLDFATGWNDLSAYYTGTQQQSAKWITWVRQCLAFRHIPLSNLEDLSGAFESVAVRAGEVVVREGEPAVDYYLIESGSAAATRETGGSVPAGLTTLEFGDGFGEECLMRTDEHLSTTVTMRSPGTLLRLSRRQFLSWCHEQPRSLLSPSQAIAQVASGAATWTDVRRPEETVHKRISNAKLLPLRRLHELDGTLSRDFEYICYCNSGRRSAVAADLLARHGLRAHVLEGGLWAMQESGLEAVPE